MIESFMPLRQSPGSNSCLPTCVRAVLLWLNYPVTLDEVSEWCYEDALGCDWSESLNGLTDVGFEVEELREGTGQWRRLQELVSDTNDPQPVIVTLQEPFRDFNGDHAVVVVEVTTPTEENPAGLVIFMDPLGGTFQHDTIDHFLACWSQADERAFTISP